MLVNPTGFLHKLEEFPKPKGIQYIYVMRDNTVRVNYKAGFHVDITPKLVGKEIKYLVLPNTLLSEDELVKKILILAESWGIFPQLFYLKGNVVEMVYTLVLGTNAISIRVQIPSLPYNLS